MEWAARLLATPENRSAIAAIQDVLFGLTAGTAEPLPNPLFLHGPSGSGKTFLLQALIAELNDCGKDVCSMSANDFATTDDLTEALDADLLVVEDLQHLPMRFVDTLIRVVDVRAGAVTIVTALHGPGNLTHRGKRLPVRLTNRLAAGLVLALEPMQSTGRRRLLQLLAEEAKVTIAPEILDWLAQQLTGGGRQLEGAIRQLKALQRLQSKPLRLTEVRLHFRAQVDAKSPTVERITEHVSGYFQVAPKQLQSTGRSHDVLLPRQVSMYLARQLTRLSLQKIGTYFGGRDHKTVLHACRRVETAMKADATLCGAVKRMHAELA